MALDVNRLLDELDDARESTLALIDKFKKIADSAQLFEGIIAQKIPLNLKKDIDIISDLSEGQAENSLTSLITLVESVPIGQIRNRKAIKATLDPQGTQIAGSNASNTAEIDTTPDIGAGAQSAVAAAVAPTSPLAAHQESALSRYLKAGKLKEQNARFVANTINLGQALAGLEESSTYGHSMNELVSPDFHYNLDKIVESNPVAADIGNAFDVSLHSNMAKVRESVARMHEGEEATPVPSWRDAANSVHMNETLNGFDGMFGGAANSHKLSLNESVANLSFEDMFAGGIKDGSACVHTIEGDWNK